MSNEAMSKPIDTTNVTRVEVIDSTGRAYVNYCLPCERVEVYLQDDGRTLKIFITK